MAGISIELFGGAGCAGAAGESFQFSATQPTSFTDCIALHVSQGANGYANMVCGGSAVEIYSYLDTDCSSGQSGFVNIAHANVASFWSGSCVETVGGGSYVKFTYAPTACDPCANCASVTGDPITAYGNKRAEFHIPVGIPHLLFQGLYMKVWGSTFPGLFGDQYLERVFVMSKTDNKVVDVAVKSDLKDFDRNSAVPGEFESLKVAVKHPEETELKAVAPSQSRYLVDDLALSFTVDDLALSASGHTSSEIPRRECVTIKSATSTLAVCSSSAEEAFGDLGASRIAWEFAHLDMTFDDLDAEGPSSLKGMLPELWGLIPMSNKTRSHIVAQWSAPEAVPSGRGAVDRNVTKPASKDSEITV